MPTRARHACSARRSGRRRWRVALSRCSHAVCKAASRRRMRSSHPSRCFCRTPATASSPTARISSSRTAGALTPPLHTASTEPSSATRRTSPPSSSSSVEEPAARSGARRPPPPVMARSATGTGELAYRTAVSRSTCSSMSATRRAPRCAGSSLRLRGPSRTTIGASSLPTCCIVPRRTLRPLDPRQRSPRGARAPRARARAPGSAQLARRHDRRARALAPT
jgi:hypothetical protein